MCIVCVEWQSGKLTSKEALRNLGEMIVSEDESKDHYFSVVEKIMDKEVPVTTDEELDAAWQKENIGD